MNSSIRASLDPAAPPGAADGTHPARAVVDLDAIGANYRLLRERAGGRRLYAVVKGNAYGHGDVAVSRRLVREGADCFAVATAAEAVALRRGDVSGEILVLIAADRAEAGLCRSYGLVPCLHDLAQARAFAEASSSFAEPLPVHVKVDTGMARLGVRPEQLGALIDLLHGARGLRVAGVFTQLASGEDPSEEPTRSQIGIFRTSVGMLSAAGLGPGIVHAANSGALLAHPEALFDAVRPGIALYGVLPSESLPDPGLVPAMRVETQVLSVRDLPSGARVGYGGAFVTTRPSRLAALPIGYDDGLRRSFSGRVPVLLRGRRAPIVGMVNMDLTLIDATDCGAEPGDPAVVLGRSGSAEIACWELARAAGTIPYEILCGIGARVRRVHTPDGATL